MKRIILMIVIVILALSVTVNAQDQRTQRTVLEFALDSSVVYVNGVKKAISKNEQVVPMLNQATGHTIVPLRCVAENMGYKVTWDDENKKVILTKGLYIVEITPQDSYPDIKVSHGSRVEYEGPLSKIYYARIKYNCTYVSLNFIADVLSCEVKWNSDKRVIEITEPESSEISPNAAELKDSFNKVTNKLISTGKIEDTMRTADKLYKTNSLLSVFFDDFEFEIFYDKYAKEYFPHVREIIKEYYEIGHSYIILSFDTTAETESAVKVLNKLYTVKFSEMSYMIFVDDV